MIFDLIFHSLLDNAGSLSCWSLAKIWLQMQKTRMNFKRLNRENSMSFFSKTKFSYHLNYKNSLLNCENSPLVALIDDEAEKEDFQASLSIVETFTWNITDFSIHIFLILDLSTRLSLETPKNERNCSKYRSVSKSLSRYISNAGLFVYYQSSQVFPIWSFPFSFIVYPTVSKSKIPRKLFCKFCKSFLWQWSSDSSHNIFLKSIFPEVEASQSKLTKRT